MLKFQIWRKTGLKIDIGLRFALITNTSGKSINS